MQTLQSFLTEQKESEPILPCSTLSSLEKHTFQVSDEIPMRPKMLNLSGSTLEKCMLNDSQPGRLKYIHLMNGAIINV